MRHTLIVSPYARSLRGGSSGGGSGGGGGYSGGTGTSGSSDCTGNDCDTFSIDEWIYFGIGAVLSVIYGFYYCYRYKKMKAANESMDKELDFEVAVSEAKRNITNTSSPDYSSIPRYQTYEGTFDSKYSDRGKTLEALLTLRLVNDGVRGYAIEGEGRDKDGNTKVTDGFITYNGNAWWLEEALFHGNTGLKVLSQGTFDLAANTFAGTWKSSTKYHGNYVSFVGKDMKKTIAPDMEESDINDFRAKLELEISSFAQVY